MICRGSLISSFVVSIALVLGVSAATLEADVDVFRKGEAGYFCIKIPDLLVTINGTILAFGEARRPDCSDYTWTDLVLKRSVDHGRSWGALSVVWSNSTNSSHAVIGNAAPVQDRVTGRLIVPFCRNNLDVLVTYSSDEGLSWTTPRLLVGVTDPRWKWVGTGPPATLQLSAHSKFPNRLVTPGYHSFFHYDDGEVSHSHAMYSDDGGTTWKLAGTVPNEKFLTNECQVVELANGTIFMNARGFVTHRLSSYSHDGGISWTPAEIIAGLSEPFEGCEGAMATHPATGDIYFSVPINPSILRYNLTLFVSKDQTQSWQPVSLIENGRSAYSALYFDRDQLLILYEKTTNLDPVFIPTSIVFKTLRIN